MPDRIYLDHAATTPMTGAARAAMIDGMARWANPSSPHAEGRAARAALEDARDRIRSALNWRHELIFTSGATEALALAIGRQARERPVLVGATEHLAVLRHAPRDARMLEVGSDGQLDPDGFGAALRGATAPLVVVQHANNETGIVQPIAELIEVVDLVGGVMLVDCAQSAAKLPLPEVDLMVVSAHKLGGPPGVGALLVRDAGLLAPLGVGGQEDGYRDGTENLPAILGFAAALGDAPLIDAPAPYVEQQTEWRILLDTACERLGGEPVGGHCALGSPRIPTIGSYRMPGISAASQLIRLDAAGFAVSAGSACASGTMHASHVLLAMGHDERAAGEVIRVSFGRSTTAREVDAFADVWAAIITDTRARA